MKQRVIPRDYQLDPVKDQPLHVDFLRLKPGSSLRVQVPVHFLNQDICPGIKRGGTLNIVRHAIEMRVPADDIPEAVIADLAALQINDSVHITELPLPEGCKPTQRERDFTIATISPPLVAAEEPAAAAATSAAPAAAADAKVGRRAASLPPPRPPVLPQRHPRRAKIAGHVCARIIRAQTLYKAVPGGRHASLRRPWQYGQSLCRPSPQRRLHGP